MFFTYHLNIKILLCAINFIDISVISDFMFTLCMFVHLFFNEVSTAFEFWMLTHNRPQLLQVFSHLHELDLQYHLRYFLKTSLNI